AQGYIERDDIDHQHVVRSAEVVPEPRRASGHRRLARIGAGEEVGSGLAPQSLLDLERGTDLRELEGHAGDRDVDQRPIDRTEILLCREQQMARDVAADANGDGERLRIPGDPGWLRVSRFGNPTEQLL